MSPRGGPAMAIVIVVSWAGVSLPWQEPSFSQTVEGKLGTNPMMIPLPGRVPPFGRSSLLAQFLVHLIWLYFAGKSSLCSVFSTQHVLVWLGTHVIPGAVQSPEAKRQSLR